MERVTESSLVVSVIIPPRAAWRGKLVRCSGRSAPPGGFDLGDVDFLLPHHGFERALGGGRIMVGIDIHELARGYLPVQAPFVLAPVALAFLAAIADDSIPVAVDFLLIFGHYLERKVLVLR